MSYIRLGRLCFAIVRLARNKIQRSLSYCFRKDGSCSSRRAFDPEESSQFMKVTLFCENGSNPRPKFPENFRARRLIVDDRRGVNESLNETQFGQGMVVRRFSLHKLFWTVLLNHAFLKSFFGDIRAGNAIFWRHTDHTISRSG